VPAPARGRYLEHLADCEACRSLVIDLSQAAGAAARYEVPQPQRGSSFWQKVVALFSPAVLRFAVPALVLTAVIGIGFIAFWRPGRPELVASRGAEDSHPVANEHLNDGQAVDPATAATPSVSSGTPIYDGRTQTEKGDLQDKKATVPLESTPADSIVAKAPAKDAGQAGEGAGLVATEPYAPEPKAAAPPQAPTIFSEADKSAELAKERPAKREDQVRSRDEFRNQAADEEHGPSRSRNNSALPSGQRAGTLSGRGPSGLDKNKVGAVETRSVSGRRFTREDSVWVDADYNPPRATITVTRGTEQFRALVADEPGIRAIADQLSGAVIVVWKSRAYRIQ
jgi:hypothetical protein